MNSGTKKFSRSSTAEEVVSSLDLSGKTIMITGVNSGLGFEAMRVLAKQGAHIIASARSKEKAEQACSMVKGETSPVACELSDMASVVQCATEVKNLAPKLDVLICNAGIMALPQLQVKDGLELQFLTNHMGHFLLATLLKDALISSQGRLVMLSSAAHQLTVKGGIDFSNLDGSKGYNPWRFYGQSKLANLLTALAFNEHFAGTGATANAVHPGVIKTNLGRDLDGVLGFLTQLPLTGKILELSGGKTIAQGAATECFVAAHPNVQGLGGKYFADSKVTKASKHGRNEILAEKLWQYSLDYLSDYLENPSSKQTRKTKKQVEVIGEDS